MEREEVENMLKQMAANKGQSTKDEDVEYYVRQYLVAADYNEDGRISKKEFYRFYKLFWLDMKYLALNEDIY